MFFKLGYYLLVAVLFILSFPLLVLLSFKPKYKDSIPARFWLSNNPPFNKENIWFHACSLGEAKSLKPFVDALGSDNINISVITNTGFEEAKKLTQNVRFLPFEHLIGLWQQKAKTLFVLEAELWYLLFLGAKRRGTKTVLLNARMSDRSFKSYLRLKWFYKKVFANIDAVFAQSTLDAERLKQLGANNIEVIGNIKMANEVVCSYKYHKPEDYVIVGASTHEGEEQIILDAYQKYNRGKLILVPRHPERFDTVSKMAEKFAKAEKKSFQRFSKKQNFDSDIIVVDMMGELIEIYAIADVVILAGSLVPNIGGHNPLEPTALHCKVISGKEIFNLKSIFDGVEHIIFTDAQNLIEALLDAEVALPAEIKHQVDIDDVLKKLSHYL
jgi:3-deoxy-D-manno-octulosonic-acid transferase